jgi:hypothetical protein
LAQARSRMRHGVAGFGRALRGGANFFLAGRLGASLLEPKRFPAL